MSRFITQRRAATSLLLAANPPAAFDMTTTRERLNVRAVLSGALVANTPKTLVTLTGRGVLHSAVLWQNDGGSRNCKIIVIIDGVTVYDPPLAPIVGLNYGIVAVGNSAGFQPLAFNSSCVLRIVCHVDDPANSLTLGYNAEMQQ